MGVHVNYCGADDHIPQAERNIRVIKERLRCYFNDRDICPCVTMPIVMLEQLVADIVAKLNWFCPKGGLSSYYSPHIILTGKQIDMKKTMPMCIWFLC